jgi:hypothetical protein
MLGRTLKMAFWVTYDHVGKLILASVVWFLGVSIPGSLGWALFVAGNAGARLLMAGPLLVLGFGVMLPVLTAGLAHMAKILIETHDGSIGDMFRGIRLYAGRAVVIGLVYLFGIVSLAISTWFYAAKLQDSVPWLGYGISALAAWALVFAAISALLVMPALVQKKGGALASVKLAALLVLANPLFAAGLAVQVLGVTVLALVVTPLMPLLYGAAVVVMASSAYEMLARRYAANTPGAPQPPRDEDDDYLNRGFRDFLFPWKG